MANGILSNPGVNLGTTDGTWEKENANFLKIFTGEIITAYTAAVIMDALHMQRTITHGKSASFPTTGTATARYHTPGTPILGSNKIKHGEKVINIDDLLIADVMIYNLDEAKNHYDVRSEYSKKLGVALATAKDKRCLQTAILAARSAANIPGETPGGSVVTNALFATDGEKLGDALFDCAQLLDEKNVAKEDRACVVRPAQYYLMARTVKLLDNRWGGSGTYADADIVKVAHIPLKMSNNLPNSLVTALPGENNKYNGDFSKTVAAVFHKDAIGTVKLKDLAVQKTGGDFEVMYQATLLVAKYAMGHGILRPECAIELSK